ncbi:helix-turn-helix transcriptional regulator [uncultured bacterium]|nr:helix-turn-helix transcriptional regulator [uncultured bacterium]
MSNLFGDALQKIRIKKNLSLSDVCDKSGLSFVHLLRLEQGKKIHITTSTIDRLALGLDVPISKLVQLYGKSLQQSEHTKAKGLDLNQVLQDGTPLNWHGIQLDDDARHQLQLWFEDRYED